MVGQTLHKFDLNLSRYVLDNVNEHFDSPRFYAFAHDHLSEPLFAHLLALRSFDEPPELLLGKGEFDELLLHFSGDLIEVDRSWSKYGKLHARHINCITEIRERLAPSVGVAWADASSAFSARLESSRLRLEEGIEIVWDWIKELRRLLRAMGAIQWLPAPDGPFPTPTTRASLLSVVVEQDRGADSEPAEAEDVAIPASLTGDLLLPMLERLAVALDKLPSAGVSGLPPEALSKEEAAKFLGVEVATIEYLIRTHRIEYVQYGDQRGRIVPVDSLRKFIASNRQCTAADLLNKRKK